eukprot:scaffold619299_cov22-Prasinocladus_malaysianus.AAC.1
MRSRRGRLVQCSRPKNRANPLGVTTVVPQQLKSESSMLSRSCCYGCSEPSDEAAKLSRKLVHSLLPFADV